LQSRALPLRQCYDQPSFSVPRTRAAQSTTRPVGWSVAEVADSVGLTLVNSVEVSVGKLWDTSSLLRSNACLSRDSGVLSGAATVHALARGTSGRRTRPRPSSGYFEAPQFAQ
jgi:hypothetical protein